MHSNKPRIYRIINNTAAILLISLSTPIFGQTATPPSTIDNSEQILGLILKQHGVGSKKISDFYMAGHDCHEHKLKNINYLINPDGIIFFFNDALGNCIMAEFGAATLPNGEQGGSVCYITDSIYQQLYTSKNKLAASTYENSKDTSPEFTEMIKILDQCAKQTSRSKIILLLESSDQLKQK